MQADTFAARLRAAREAAGLTQQQVADKSGLDRISVLEIEGGKREPKIGTARKLADAIGASLQDLVPPAEPRQ